MKRSSGRHGALAAFAVAGALSAAGCGEEDAVNEAQDEIQRQDARTFTQGIPTRRGTSSEQAGGRRGAGPRTRSTDLTNEGREN